MSDTRVTRLRHIGLAAPNLEAAVTFYERDYGLIRVEGDRDIAFLATEGSPEQYILRVRKAEEKRVDLLAFGVQDSAAVDALAASLAEDNIPFVSEPRALQTPGGGYGVRFFDPDGHVIEVSSDVEERPFREIKEREMTPTKLSHVVLSSPQIEKTLAFYLEKLGFKLSAWIEERMCFTRCTMDQHNLAIVRGNNAQLNHIAMEYRGLDEYLRVTGRVLKNGGIMRWGPGRHGVGVGDNAFSYFWDPNGHVAEVTTCMQQCDEDWKPIRLTEEQAGDQWGTEVRIDVDKVPESALVPESGLWQAPPI